MGCGIFFIAMINHPELNDKVEVMVALAPGASVAHMKGPTRYIAPFEEQMQVRIQKFQEPIFNSISNPVFSVRYAKDYFVAIADPCFSSK